MSLAAALWATGTLVAIQLACFISFFRLTSWRAATWCLLTLVACGVLLIVVWVLYVLQPLLDTPLW